MGYETTFRLKKELDSEFKSYMKEVKKEELEMYKTVLVSLCMRESNFADLSEWNLIKIYKELRTGFDMYVNYLIEEWKIWIEKELKENNNEVWFCGWDKSKNDCVWNSKEEIANYFLSNIFLYATTPHTSPFGKIAGSAADDDSYYNKLERLHEYIDDIDDAVTEMMDFKFINRYRNNEDADESDGYEHHFPEEKDEDDEIEYEDTNESTISIEV